MQCLAPPQGSLPDGQQPGAPGNRAPGNHRGRAAAAFVGGGAGLPPGACSPVAPAAAFTSRDDGLLSASPPARDAVSPGCGMEVETRWRGPRSVPPPAPSPQPRSAAGLAHPAWRALASEAEQKAAAPSPPCSRRPQGPQEPALGHPSPPRGLSSLLSHLPLGAFFSPRPARQTTLQEWFISKGPKTNPGKVWVCDLHLSPVLKSSPQG